MQRRSKLLFLGATLLAGAFCGTTFGIEAMQPTPKEEAQLLVDALIPVAERFLIKQSGEFYPFGAKIDANGKIVHFEAFDGREHPPSAPLIDIMHTELAKEAKQGSIRCSAVAYDARVVPPGSTEKTDAVVIELEHKDGYNVIVAFPYKLERGRVEFGAAFAANGDHHVFPLKR